MTAPAPRQLAPQRNKAGSNAPRSALRRWLGGTFWTLVPLVAGLYIASGLFNSRVADRLQNIVFDQYQRWHPRPWNPNGPVRVILIDDHSIAKHGQWPWPRETFAKLIDRLNAAGAAVIAFDMVFAEQDRLARSAILKRLPDVPERKALEKALQDKGMLDETGMQNRLRRPVSYSVTCLPRPAMRKQSRSNGALRLRVMTQGRSCHHIPARWLRWLRSPGRPKASGRSTWRRTRTCWCAACRCSFTWEQEKLVRLFRP